MLGPQEIKNTLPTLPYRSVRITLTAFHGLFKKKSNSG